MRAFALAIVLAGCLRFSEASAQPLLVSQASDKAYHSLQSAIDALPPQGGAILIAPGTYREKVKVSKPGVHIKGTGKRPHDTVIVYGDGAINVGGTSHSATLDASGDDFRLDNLTVQNDYSLNPANPPSQAVALSLTGDKDVITRVRLLGAQDTLFANKGPDGRMSRQYFWTATSRGTSILYLATPKPFRHCELHGVANHAVVYTAQSRASPDEDSAYVFDHCRLSADPAARDIALGRAWRPYAAVIFLSADIDAPVISEGWREWTPGKTKTLRTAYYAEYKSTGIGANPTRREPYAHQLTDDEAPRWSLKAFFAGATDWLSYQPN
ncbi:pectinesterase family protein [Bradyrhizobium sp. BR 1433]|uniref:pectinesterase family protein n=1 Tax=Bradyrhizobium sp. BR 1433 TaxID=3447967 RepID=UPI003EE6CDB3